MDTGSPDGQQFWEPVSRDFYSAVHLRNRREFVLSQQDTKGNRHLLFQDNGYIIDYGHELLKNCCFSQLSVVDGSAVMVMAQPYTQLLDEAIPLLYSAC